MRDWTVIPLQGTVDRGVQPADAHNPHLDFGQNLWEKCIPEVLSTSIKLEFNKIWQYPVLAPAGAKNSDQLKLRLLLSTEMIMITRCLIS